MGVALRKARNPSRLQQFALNGRAKKPTLSWLSARRIDGRRPGESEFSRLLDFPLCGAPVADHSFPVTAGPAIFLEEFDG
jgi:hypothetical protein